MSRFSSTDAERFWYERKKLNKNVVVRQREIQHTQWLHSEPHKANPWNVSSCGWWNIHGGGREKKLTKTVCGSRRNITVPAMLNKSHLNRRNYHSGDRGNLFINFALRNAFLMAQRWCVQTGKQSYSSVLSFWQTIHILILAFVTPAAEKMLRCFLFSRRTFSILQPRLGREIYKDIFWIETKILTTPCRRRENAEKSVASQPLKVHVWF